MKPGNNIIYSHFKEIILGYKSNQMQIESVYKKLQNPEERNQRILSMEWIPIHNTIIQNKDVISLLTYQCTQCNFYQKFILMHILKDKRTKTAQTFWKWIK